MAAKYRASRVINGTWGECYLDDDDVIEITGLTLNVARTKEDVVQCGTLMQGSKVTATKGTGTMKMNKINSRIAKKEMDAEKKGVFPEHTIISHLKDPDNGGAERVKVTGVVFDELTLADWEAAKKGEITAAFTFDDYKFIDVI